MKRWSFLAVLALVAGCSSSGSTSDAGTDAGDLDAGFVYPVVTSIDPNHGPADGGTSVTIAGSNFASGATVRIGGVPLASLERVSDSQIRGVTAPNAAGNFDVLVINPDQRQGTLRRGFTYDAPVIPPVVGWCALVSPTDAGAVAGTPIDLYGQVWVDGVTNKQGPGSGVKMQAAIGFVDGGGFAWQDTAYNKEVGNNDEYVFHTTTPGLTGTYAMAFRAQVPGSDWTYCELDKNYAPLDPAHTGHLVVTGATPGQIDWCNLQSPQQLTAAPDSTFDVYGQVYVAGVTDKADAGAGVEMQFGLGLATDAGSWSWSATHFNVDVGNNDEYTTRATVPPLGDYLMAFRARLNGGAWQYCEKDGKHAALDLTAAGTLTSATQVPGKVDYCGLLTTSAGPAMPGSPLLLQAEVYKAGLTNASGQGAGIVAQAGIEWSDGGWSWTDASYFGDTNNNANDGYQLQTVFPADVGTYGSAFRVQLSGGPWVYCERDGNHDTLDLSQAGTISVQSSVVAPVGWCNLQYPISAQAQPGDVVPFYGQVLVDGVTNDAGQGPGVRMQFGLSQGDGGYGWSDAVYNVDVGNNDEYTFALTAPGAGSYTYLFRAALDGGPWTYCEVGGPHGSTIDPSALGTLTVSTTSGTQVNWCNLQYPADAGVAEGQAQTFYGQVYQPGITEAPGQGAGIWMQFGYASVDAGIWSWSDAGFNAGHTGDSNDEYLYALTAPAGTYRTAFRAKLDGGSWTYCEPAGPSPTLDWAGAGNFVVTSSASLPTAIGWCNLQFPGDAGVLPGAPLDLYGQVWVDGVTNGSGAGSGVHMQGAIGTADGGFTWQDAVFNIDVGNNDEYVLHATSPAQPGTYASVFRAQVNGGPWSYCEVDQNHDAFDPTHAGQVVDVAGVTWCNLQWPLAPPAAQVSAGSPITFYGRVYQGGVTDSQGQGSGIAMEFGYGYADGGGWVWKPAVYGSDNGNNDEYQTTIAAPAAATYRTAYRASLNGGPWLYCTPGSTGPVLDPSAGGTFVTQ